MTRRSIIAGAMSVALALCVQAQAQFTIQPSVIGNGATKASSASFSLSGTVGQSAIGVVSGTSNEVDAGFWPAAKALSVPIEVSIPHVTAQYKQSLSVPVEISHTSGISIVSTEIFVTFDSDVVSAQAPDKTGTLLTTNWTVQHNIIEGNGSSIDTIKIAAATDEDVLSGTGALINLNFTVLDLREPDSTPLGLDHVLLNDGTTDPVRIDGSLTVTGTDGVLTTVVVESGSATEVIPRETLLITVTDIDEDRDDTQIDQITVSVTNDGQTETVTLDENGVTTGVFSATIVTEYSETPLDEDGTVQAVALDIIEIDYVDLLDGTGVTTPRSNSLNVLGGFDGELAASLVTQPGDDLRVRVVDADLNTDPGVTEQTTITVTALSGDTEVVNLDEQGIDTDVFFGKIPTGVGAIGVDGVLQTIKGDVVDIVYVDDLTLAGSTVDLATTHDVVDPMGDADGNSAVQAFDAAQVLQHALNPFLTGTELLAADVDVTAHVPATDANEFDAAKILQKRVGIITVFPAQEATADQHPQPESGLNPKPVVDTRPLALVPGDGYVAVWSDDRSQIISGDFTLAGVQGEAVTAEELGEFMLASRLTNDGMRIVMAGAQSISGPGELLRIYPKGNADGARLAAADLNGGTMEAWYNDKATVSRSPESFQLHGNMPNPFNPETVIRFDLPTASDVRLEVFDILGQKVRTLIASERPAGTHQAVWDGRNTQGVQVGNGTYFYRLVAGDNVQMRRMLLLK